MDTLVDGVWRLLCASVICALCLSISGEGSGQGMRKLLCGAFLAAVALSAFAGFEFDDLYESADSYHRAAQAVAAEGIEEAARMKKSLIQERCEAYILDTADEMGLQITVEVMLDRETMIPMAAVIAGDLTPWEKQTLGGEITKALGLKKEAVAWKSGGEVKN